MGRKILIGIVGSVIGPVLILGAMVLAWWVSNDFSFYKTIRY